MTDVLKQIEKSIEQFQKQIPDLQKGMFDEIVMLTKELDSKNGKIETSAKNLRLLAKIKAKIERVLFNEDYRENLKQYIKSFNEITKLQNQYFKELDNKFTPTALMNELKVQSVDATLQSLGKAGITNNISERIVNIIRTGITSGASFTQLNNTLREFVLDTDSGQGVLVKYTKQIATDALNQYAANYTQAVTSDLGLEWYQYTGTLIETSRCFCEALVEKRYVHVSEIPKIIKGDFKEFKEKDCELNPKTGLPQGMIAGTNAANFATYRGGYNCGHQLIAVSSVSVPKSVKDKI